MNRAPITSSNIASVGYDRKTGLCEVEFRGGGTYQYSGVPEGTMREWIAAPSKGQFFHRRIRSSFQWRKIQ